MNDVLERIIADGQERQWPQLIDRDTEIREHAGKISVVLGMRRVGKTSLCIQKIQSLKKQGVPSERILYINFEDERLLPFETRHFQQLLDVYFRMFPQVTQGAFYLFMDEPQRIEGWELFARRLLDEGRARIYITGSSAKLLSREIATSLRGRSLSTELFPLRFSEYLRFQTIEYAEHMERSTAGQAILGSALHSYLKSGGFPEVQAGNEAICRDILRGYVDVVLLRDVIERHNISNVSALRALVRQALQAPGGLFSVNKFYGQLKSMGVPVAKNSLYHYIDCFADAYLLYPVEMHTRSMKKRQVNPRKMYVVDTGLINAHSMGMTEDRGALLENMIYMQLRSKGLSVDYVVTDEGYEVDFLAGAEQGIPQLLQVSWSLEQANTFEREVRSLSSALDEGIAKTGNIITFDATIPHKVTDERIQIIPAFRWLLGCQ